MDGKRDVVLFRSKGESDRFEVALEGAGFATRFIPVLRFDFVNAEALRNALEHPHAYAGLIVTSPRAVEALVEAMAWLPSENVAWHSKAIFAVGPATASELKRVGFEPTGEESGSAALLADIIVDREFDKPLLFLCGRRRLEKLPKRLQESRIAFEELCVYETTERTDLALKTDVLPDWVVFFSPSGVDAVRLDGGWDLEHVRIATIGSSTADAARLSGLHVHAVARNPTPEGIAQAMAAADRALSI